MKDSKALSENSNRASVLPEDIMSPDLPPVPRTRPCFVPMSLNARPFPPGVCMAAACAEEGFSIKPLSGLLIAPAMTGLSGFPSTKAMSTSTPGVSGKEKPCPLPTWGCMRLTQQEDLPGAFSEMSCGKTTL